MARDLTTIAGDEARHLGLGPELVERFGAREIAAGIDLAKEVAKAFAAMLASTSAAAVFAQLFNASAWERDLWMERAFNSKSHRRQSRRVLASVLGQLKRVSAAAPARSVIASQARSGDATIDARAIVKTEHPHYDDGNGLFAEIIGPSMAYSSAIWTDGASTLEEAGGKPSSSKGTNRSGLRTSPT
jgi:hypothetical protein